MLYDSGAGNVRFCMWNKQVVFGVGSKVSISMPTQHVASLLILDFGNQHSEHPFDTCELFSYYDNLQAPLVKKNASEMQLFPNHFGYYAIARGDMPTAHNLIVNPRLVTKENNLNPSPLHGRCILDGLKNKQVMQIGFFFQTHKTLWDTCE